MQFLESLGQTPLILWVAESDYGYPIILTLHSIGMALVVGIMLITDLRVLGVAKSIALPALRAFFLFAWIGLAINAGSGTLLFLANSSAFLTNTAFLTKITLLIIAGIATFFLGKELQLKSSTLVNPNNRNPSTGNPSNKARVIAGLCVLLWLGAITAGRIVGYTSVPE